MNRTALTSLLTFCITFPAVGNEYGSDLPIVRATLVPPAAVEEQIETPSGHYHGLKSLSEMNLGTRPPEGPLPEDVSGEFFPKGSIDVNNMRELRDWPITVFHWHPPEVYHRPLYFDHVSLEVYGQSVDRHLQPLLSGARFFATIPLLPIKMARTHPHVHISALGQYRPGSPTPCLLQKCMR